MIFELIKSVSKWFNCTFVLQICCVCLCVNKSELVAKFELQSVVSQDFDLAFNFLTVKRKSRPYNNRLLSLYGENTRPRTCQYGG